MSVATAGCFLPVNFTEPASPALVGIVRRSDGTPPAAGVRVAVSGDYRDETCARASERGATDAAGFVRLRATTVRVRWIMIIPPFERFVNFYRLCVGTTTTTTTTDARPAAVYDGYVSLGYKYEDNVGAPDTVRCLEWEWQARTRLTCAGPRNRETVQTGGSWVEPGGASGYYRLITTVDEKDAGSRGVFLQWVQRSDAGVPERVRETIELPLAPRFLALEEARLWLRPGLLPCVSVASTGKSPRRFAWHNPRLVTVLELGPPGETRERASCDMRRSEEG